MTVRKARMAATALLVLLVAAILWAVPRENFVAALRALWVSPWGRVTLFDLYAGLAVVAGYIGYVEPRKAVAVVWIIALLCLGNVATLAYVLSRLARVSPVTSRTP